MKNGKNEIVVEDSVKAYLRFEEAVKQSLTVSKKEILHREKKWKADRKRKLSIAK